MVEKIEVWGGKLFLCYIRKICVRIKKSTGGGV